VAASPSRSLIPQTCLAAPPSRIRRSLGAGLQPSVGVLDWQPTKGSTGGRWMWPRRDR
jgi:hypothetical protein